MMHVQRNRIFASAAKRKAWLNKSRPEERGREGNRRNPATWRAFTGTAPEPLFDRGFTGHEHLYAFNLINMNGRVYDPVVARFLSPDPYIQAPGMPQNYNGYVYCLNNPLVYTDPSGEVFGIDDLIIIGLTITGAYLGGVATNEGELNPVKWNYNSASTYIGIATGALFGYVGGYGIVHPGTISLALGITTPAAGVYLVGNQSDWSFEWTTMAGGEGSIETNKPTSIEDIIRGSNSSIPVYTGGYSNYMEFNEQMDAYFNMAMYSPNSTTLPSIEVVWHEKIGVGYVKGGIPFWWGLTDQMKNPLAQYRILDEGSEILYITVGIPFAIIGAGEIIGYIS